MALVSLNTMRAEYARLIQEGVTDPTAWQAVHRLLPNQAEKAMLLAVLGTDQGFGALVRLVMAFTESPAQLFTRLGDGVDFDESLMQAAFASDASCRVFRSRFPGWKVEQRWAWQEHG